MSKEWISEFPYHVCYKSNECKHLVRHKDKKYCAQGCWIFNEILDYPDCCGKDCACFAKEDRHKVDDNEKNEWKCEVEGKKYRFVTGNEGNMAEISDVDRHKNICMGIHGTYIAKNNDYGNSFSKSFDKYGITCAMVRMEDKWNRLESLVSGKKQMVNDESIKDTLLDLANYAIMTVMELENREK